MEGEMHFRYDGQNKVVEIKKKEIPRVKRTISFVCNVFLYAGNLPNELLNNGKSINNSSIVLYTQMDRRSRIIRKQSCT